MGFVEGLVRLQSKAASDDVFVDLGVPPKIETISLNPGRAHDSSAQSFHGRCPDPSRSLRLGDPRTGP
jgi:hypothetical protein